MTATASTAIVPDGLVAVVKRDCPTCTLVAPVLRDLADARRAPRLLAGRPDVPRRHRRAPTTPTLDVSFALDIDTVPTLLRVEDGASHEPHRRLVARALGGAHRARRPRRRPPRLPARLRLAHARPRRRRRARGRRDGAAASASRRLELGAAEDELEAMFDRGWTDGLPVVPPTVERGRCACSPARPARPTRSSRSCRPTSSSARSRRSRSTR